MPVRPEGPAGDRADRHTRTHQLRLALLPARSPARPALRLPRARSVRAGARRSVQRAQAAARPVRPPGGRAAALDRRALRLSRRKPARRSELRYARQRVGDAQVPGDRLRRSPGATTYDRKRRGNDTVIYELHVKGFTQLHPAIRPQLRGTYAGLSTAPVIAHLQRLGVTAVELMPVHLFVDDQALVQRGLRNYWGYNSIGFFAPDTRYAAGDAVNEFKTMVKTLHAAGIEVILDVVYNHTAEGNHLGPTLSFRGIDNRVYYRLDPENPRHYVDYTGTGNTLNTVHPAALQLVMDSLRYWVTEMHVDGFRFDLAATLGRTDRAGRSAERFFRIACARTLMLAHVKLIAEPWDLGDGRLSGRQFPARLVGMERQVSRRRTLVLERRRRRHRRAGVAAVGIERSVPAAAAARRQASTSSPRMTASRCTTSSATTKSTTRPTAKTTATAKPTIAAGTAASKARPTTRRSARCASGKSGISSTTLLLSQGVPMLLGGDEMGRTQQGNNNAYCQDSELSWVDWKLGPRRAEPDRFHPSAGRAAQRPSAVSPPHVLSRPLDRRCRRQGHRLAQSRRPGDNRRRLAQGVRALPGRVPVGARPGRKRCARRSARRRRPAAAVERASRSDSRSCCRNRG